jgi:hypothetical protein
MGNSTHRAPIAPLNATSNGTMAAAIPALVAAPEGPCAGAFTPTPWRLFSAI